MKKHWTKKEKIIGIGLKIYKILKDMKADQSKLIGMWKNHLENLLIHISNFFYLLPNPNI
ncbi:MAG: hypothetical protein ACFFAU_15145 [Candidatus Hodarchaeota archaeon]